MYSLDKEATVTGAPAKQVANTPATNKGAVQDANKLLDISKSQWLPNQFKDKATHVQLVPNYNNSGKAYQLYFGQNKSLVGCKGYGQDNKMNFWDADTVENNKGWLSGNPQVKKALQSAKSGGWYVPTGTGNNNAVPQVSMGYRNRLLGNGLDSNNINQFQNINIRTPQTMDGQMQQKTASCYLYGFAKTAKQSIAQHADKLRELVRNMTAATKDAISNPGKYQSIKDKVMDFIESPQIYKRLIRGGAAGLATGGAVKAFGGDTSTSVLSGLLGALVADQLPRQLSGQAKIKDLIYSASGKPGLQGLRIQRAAIKARQPFKKQFDRLTGRSAVPARNVYYK